MQQAPLRSKAEAEVSEQNRFVAAVQLQIFIDEFHEQYEKFKLAFASDNFFFAISALFEALQIRFAQIPCKSLLLPMAAKRVHNFC